MSKGLQIAVATLSVFVAVGWLVASNEGAFEYFAHVSELDPADLERRDGLRVHGYVIDGSIARDVQAGYVEFALRDGAPGTTDGAAPTPYREVKADALSTVKVRYQGIDVPDLFRDGAEVVVEGGFADGQFVATRIMAKCPSKYEVAPAVLEQKA
jgi:cytochrome c-type biogenesis protein CcmE